MWGRLGSQSIAIAALAFFVSTSFLAAAAISPKPVTPDETPGNGAAGGSPGLLNIGSRGRGGHLRYVLADLPSIHGDVPTVVAFDVDQPMTLDRSVVVVPLTGFITDEALPDVSGAILTVREGFAVASAELEFGQCYINGRSQTVVVLKFSLPQSGNYKLLIEIVDEDGSTNRFQSNITIINFVTSNNDPFGPAPADTITGNGADGGQAGGASSFGCSLKTSPSGNIVSGALFVAILISVLFIARLSSQQRKQL